MMKLGYPLLSDRRFPVRAVILSLAFEKRCCCFAPSGATRGWLADQIGAAKMSL
jgi:hypothetical protein